MELLSLTNFKKNLFVNYREIDSFYEKHIAKNESISDIRFKWMQAIVFNLWYFGPVNLDLYSLIDVNLRVINRLFRVFFLIIDHCITFFWRFYPFKNLKKNSVYKIKISLESSQIIAFSNLDLRNFYSSFYNGFKNFFLPLFLTLSIILLLIDFYNINFTRQLGIWFVIGILFFWLISGFNFFIKRYRFGKFTGAIQRFWKRTNSYFWIVEGFLFSLFFYYYINSSQDVLYFVDEANLNQSFVTNLSSFYFSTILLLFLIFYSVYLLLNLPNFNFKQQILHLTVITVFFLYGFLLETYQFYYVIAGFFELVWDFSEESNSWTVDTLSPWIRTKQQYLTLALIAKYWHFLFIFISWLFMVFKFYENKRVSYTLIGVNIQNYMLLFLLNILFNINWLKWITRRYYDESYYWFFADFNYWTSKVAIDELFTFFSSFSIV